jgi:hypothetical protein
VSMVGQLERMGAFPAGPDQPFHEFAYSDLTYFRIP